jgi:hypothetical protein
VNGDVSVGGSEWMQRAREMVVARDRSTIADSARLHVHWYEYLKSVKGAQNKTGDGALLAR